MRNCLCLCFCVFLFVSFLIGGCSTSCQLWSGTNHPPLCVTLCCWPIKVTADSLIRELTFDFCRQHSCQLLRTSAGKLVTIVPTP